MTNRFEGLDRVRAGAMLLGVVYHATYAFMPDIGRWFPVQASSTWTGFVVMAGVIHAVRMPVFFTLSGFFAALVMEKRAETFLRDRFRRLMVPLLVATPLSIVADTFIRRASLAQGTMAASYDVQGAWALRPLHLWFLEYLFLFCLAARALSLTSFTIRLERLLDRWPELLLLGSVITFATGELLGEPQPAFSFIPSASAVMSFLPFFGLGWALFAARDSTAALARRGWWMALASVALCAFVFTRPLQWTRGGHFLAALAAWLMALGVLGPALRLRGSGRAGFLVQSAYWVYLVHHPLVQAGQVLVATLTWPAGVGYLLVVSGAFALSLGSFVLVRRTALAPWLGATRDVRGEVPAGRGGATPRR